MIILGITDNHDSGVVIFRDKEVIFAVNEERLNRVKITRSFPSLSIASALAETKIKAEDIDYVLIGTRITPPFLIRLFNKWYSDTRGHVSTFSYSVNLFYIWQYFLGVFTFFEIIDTYFSQILYTIKLKHLGFHCPIKFIDHHFSHASSAYYTSGLSEALIITMDGMGDSRSVTVSMGNGRRISYAIYHESGLSAISTFYSRITEYTNFRPLLHEGKVMALAAYGDSTRAYEPLRRLLRFKGGRFSKTNFFLKQSKNSGVYASLQGFAIKDIAASAQRVLEEEVCQFVEYWLKKTGSVNLVLAGGVFANIKLNQRLSLLDSVKNIYIFPHMGDGGLAYGAALAFAKPYPRKMKDAFLGPSFSEKRILGALRDRSGLSYERFDDIEKQTGLLLSEKKLIARFSGRMEYGPRALGNRSILYEATDATIKQRLNYKLRRTEFMPFAPVLQYELKDKYFFDTEKAEYTAEFLNICFFCKEVTKKTYPAIVHIDNTARPQFVKKENNPVFHRILEYYKKFSGLDILINTSFNMHEEPIICSPEEAISAFCEAELDYLILENFIVSRRSGS